MHMGVTSLNTKKMLSSSLKKFMLKKPLSKITVSEIVADCGINRKTFYYHFESTRQVLEYLMDDFLDHYLEAIAIGDDRPCEKPLILARVEGGRAEIYQP